MNWRHCSMISKYFLAAFAVTVLVAAAAVTTSAQVAELRGHVFMQQADGQKVPLADAVIDVFRTDLNAKYNTKTNKKGEFVFAGLPFTGTYTVAASHPTAAPNFVPGVKVGREIPCEITVTPGDGKRLTLEDIKAAGGGSATPPSGSSAAPAPDKAKLEELRKKNEEIEASNKKITEANDIIARTFKAGNDALNAGTLACKEKKSEEAIQKYTAAVTSYDEGLAADADQPAILTNKAVALKGRAVERYNAAITSQGSDEAKTAGLQAAREDFHADAEQAGKETQ